MLWLLEQEVYAATGQRADIELQQSAVQEVGESSAITDLSTTTLVKGTPTNGVLPLNLPQAISPTSTPTFAGVLLTGGETLRKIDVANVSIDPPSLAAQARGSVTFTLTGAVVGDLVVMMPPAGLSAGLIYCGCDVTAANTVTVYLANLTGAAIDDGALSWGYAWFDLT